MSDEDDLDQPTETSADDAGDESSVARKREVTRLAKENERSFWKRALADPVGRKALWDLLTSLGTFEDKFGVGPNGFPNVESTWCAYGQKSFGLRFYRTLMLADRAAVGSMHDECDPDFIQRKPKRTRVNG
jgi:hypothetical protein